MRYCGEVRGKSYGRDNTDPHLLFGSLGANMRLYSISGVLTTNGKFHLRFLQYFEPANGIPLQLDSMHFGFGATKSRILSIPVANI